jgi:ATP-dependent RNA helicase DDX46/PRP5
VTVEQITEREMQQQLLVQEGEEVFDSDSEEIKPSNNVITLEDILGGAEPPTTDD